MQELDTRYFLAVSVSGLNDSVQVVLTVHRIPSCILVKHLYVLLVHEKELSVTLKVDRDLPPTVSVLVIDTQLLMFCTHPL